MHIRELAGQKVCILGYGREGHAMVEAIEKCGVECDITITDENNALRITNYELRNGGDYLKNLEDFDIIIKSPGIPPSCLPLNANRLPLTNSTQIFLDTITDSNALVIGVTGSKGKSTTASLIHAMIETGGRDCVLIGNIGEPAIAHLDETHARKIFILEMSSYQLMNCTRSPHIAIITSFFPEHLDYHGSFDAYKNAKKNITRFQTKDDVVFYYKPSEGAREIAEESRGKRIPYTMNDSPIAIIDTPLKGLHNLANIAGAAKVAQHLGISKEITINAIQNFTPLPHRLQSLGVHHGIEWINDSISTTPDSTIAAIEAFDENIGTLILGGKDRGFDFSKLKKTIQEKDIKTVIVMGEIAKYFPDAIYVSSMREAKERSKGPLVLLSPASPSYDQFANFEERGKEFERVIHSLP